MTKGTPPKASKKRGFVYASGVAWVPVSLDFLQSRAGASLSPHAAKLLLDCLAKLGTNATRNGDISLTPAEMAARGWSGRESLHAAIRELIEHELLVITRYGSRLACSLFAVTLYPIDCDVSKLDAGAVGSYTTHDYARHGPDVPTKDNPAKWRRARAEKKFSVAPPRDKVTRKRPATGQSPPTTRHENGTLSRHGTKTPVSEVSNVPPRVTYIETPSACADRHASKEPA